VKFSPFLENRLAVSTSENFGIVGTGRQHILDVSISYDGFFGHFGSVWRQLKMKNASSFFASTCDFRHGGLVFADSMFNNCGRDIVSGG
jgi:hypothetical protein